ncbi:unnamed protein product [Spirodela intermedia]|uniref:Uncharacterized protein n=2 Tax=Spirodela intermedia TaxID=51605 RepID=A0A7I8JLL1_SPIIN|nr:unnamed protein product [Spirodela intermedia]CAA6671077.1 unnamed protein product [Spirodela intermedia]CAA7408186.1 unnamed protein product [Spirodela intermedia]
MTRTTVQHLHAAAAAANQEEALSFGDFPVTMGRVEDHSPPAESFEFFPIIGSDMCAAEDIFLCGQLLPYALPSPKAQRGREQRRWLSHHERSPDLLQRAESLDGRYWKGMGGGSPGYQKLRTAAGTRQISEVSTRPRWYMIAFGSVSLPAEMSLRDMKSRLRRQRRVSSGRGAAGSAGKEGRAGDGGGGGGGGKWKLIRSLSCKGDVEDVVDAQLVA